MVELIVLVLLFGLVLSSKKNMGFGNPFQVYFASWLFIFLIYGAAYESYLSATFGFLFLILLITLLAVVILFFVIHENRDLSRNSQCRAQHLVREKPVIIALFITIIAIPFAYDRATALSNDNGIFTISGYIQLRSSMTEGLSGMGIISYVSVMSFALTSVLLANCSKRAGDVVKVIVSLLASLFLLYISTGRTYVLLFLFLCVGPLVLCGKIKRRGIGVSVLLTALLFVVVATMTAKGVSVESEFSENLNSIITDLRSYLTAPLLAFSTVFESGSKLLWGENTFRFFISLLHSAKMIDHPPVSLIRDYVSVPDLTNVYTVYEVYFNDFSVAGTFIPAAFLIIHWRLYVRAKTSGGKWIYFYSASLYPLAMQFFQDQYVSLLSMWLQFAVWYSIFIQPAHAPSPVQDPGSSHR